MNINNWIKQIPYTIKIHREVTTLRKNRSINKLLKQLEICHHQQKIPISEALISLQQELPQPDQDWIDRIEVERERLLMLDEPLIEGSLDKTGLYDDGVSIRDACLVSKPAKPALMLFLLTRALKPLTVIELGTNVGISSAYISAGMKVSGKNGKITTLDASPYRQQLAKGVHCNLGIDNISYVEGLFTDTLLPTLADLGSIDLAFIDGHHQYQPTLDYFEEIFKFSTPDTVFVFDDIRWSEGMKKAWSQIQDDDRLGLIVDLVSVGICTRRQQDNPQRFVSDRFLVF